MKINRNDFICNIKDGEGVRVTKDFLVDFTKKVIENIKLYCENVGDEYLFNNTEKQFNTFLVPAFRDITDGAFMMEDSVLRNGKSSGKVDYWSNYRDCNYYFEFKYKLLNVTRYKTDQETIIKKELIQTSKDLKKQLDSIKSEVEAQAKYVKKGAFSVGLYMIPLECQVNTEESIRHNLNKIQNDIIKEFGDFYNFAYLWEIPNDLLNATSYQGRAKEYCYPGILFLYSISEIKKFQD